MHRLFLILVTVPFLMPLLHAQSATENRRATQTVSPPKLPFAHEGACPFECCQYGEWIARSPVEARASRDAASPVAFAIQTNESVTALTGVVLTTKYSLVKLLEPIEAFPVPVTRQNTEVPAGAVLYLLHADGEGSYTFWYEGGLYTAELYAETVHKGNKDFPWDVLAVPETQWWVKVRNRSGRIGWLLKPTNFHGMDACGL